MKKSKNYTTNESNEFIVNEPMPMYITSPHIFYPKKIVNEPITKEFTYKHFKKVYDKSPFTLTEWADLLFISERTLQRYSKANTAFSGLQIERILQLEKLIDFGNSLFKDEFKGWLMHKAFYFNATTPYSHLFTYEGIKEVYNLIGRMQYGTSA